METKNSKEKISRKVGAYLFAGCTLAGMGMGRYFDDLKTGLYIGMGIGCIMMAVAIASMNNKKQS